MSEQLYYTYSTIGSGTTSGERIRAQSPGIGSANSEAVRALMRYLSYRLPAGADLRTPVEVAPLSLMLVRIPSELMLVHKKYAGRDTIGRAGNFFTHAIINPEALSEQTGAVEAISARTAISLWKSPLWKVSESQAPAKSTSLENLTPQEIQQHANETWSGKLSTRALQQPYPHCLTEQQTIADWLPLVFSAFLMLETLNKTQLYIAAPAEMVATFIWCITRCLPRTLDSMQNLTFSTYEPEQGKIQVTIAGTCWLPPAHHSGPFIPQNDLPASAYQLQSGNPVLAINCYTGKYTPFEPDEHVKKFAQFATQSLLQSMAQLDQLITQAEKREEQSVDNFLTLFRIQQEEVTKETIRYIMRTPGLWPCLQYPKVQDKLIDFICDTQDTTWQDWWKRQEWEKIQRMRRLALNGSNDDAITLSTITDRIIQELCNELANEQQDRSDQVLNLVQHLDIISNPAYDLATWITLPRRLSRLPYTQTYQIWWWQKSGRKMAGNLYTFARNNTHLEAYPQLITALNQWWQGCATCLKVAWTQQRDSEMSFWLDVLTVILPPAKGDQNWHTLLKELEKTLPDRKLPAQWCKWEIYKTLLIVWKQVLLSHMVIPRQWLTMPWEHLPRFLEIAALPLAWRKHALEENILQFRAPTFSPTAHPIARYVDRCSPLIYEVLAQMIQDDSKREQALAFCEFLLEKGYATHDEGLLIEILPVLTPEQQGRMANAASLSPEQLNDLMEKTLYTTLSNQREIPNWLLPRLESYLTHFQIAAINPDHPQVSQEKRSRTYAILDALIKRNQTLHKQSRPYVICLHAVRSFFSQPVFNLNKLSMLRDQIDEVKKSETLHQGLKQEMIAFLAAHVNTEADLIRVLDIFGETLLESNDSILPTQALLLQEMVSLYSKQPQPHSLHKVILYIKVVLNEKINLSDLQIDEKRQGQFVHECLDSLLASLDPGVVESIQTTQWHLPITKLWDAYLSEHTPAEPPQTKKTVPFVRSQDWLANTTNPQATSLNSRDRAIELQGRPQKAENIDTMLKVFNNAFRSGRADKIVEAYNEALDSKLTQEQKVITSACKQLIENYDAYIVDDSIFNQDKFVNFYNIITRTDFSYIRDYPEMNKVIEKIRQKVPRKSSK